MRLPDGDAWRVFAELFGAEHERSYGFRAPADEPVELMAFRDRPRHPGACRAAGAMSALGAIPCPRVGAPWFPGFGWVDTPVLDRASLAGTPRQGPLIVQEYDATCLVPHGVAAGARCVRQHPAGDVTVDERVSPAARKALLASAVGYAMDGFDLLILGFMLRAISADLHLTPPQAGSLVTWTLIGAVAGGILFGMLGRLLRPRPRADLDDPAVRGVHRAVRPRPGLLGPAGLPHHRRPRPRRRVRHRHGAGGGSLAGQRSARAPAPMSRSAGRPACCARRW